MKARRKINTGNLRRLCWARGFEGVAGLAKALGKSRVTIHRAAKRPGLFGPTYKLMEEALLER